MANSSGNLWIYSRHIYVFANYPAVSGSKHVDRDFVRARSILDPLGDREFWREFHRGAPIKRIPPGKKWCSQHPTSRYVDEALLAKDPDRYWELLGWVDKNEFKIDARNRDGRAPVCKECRNRHDRELYAQAKAEQGKTVRSYHRRSHEQIAAMSA